MLSQQDRLSKYCMDAGFISVVENGQYFVSKDIGDLTQFHDSTVSWIYCTKGRKCITTKTLGLNFSWSKQVWDGFEYQRHGSSWRSVRRTSVTIECERYCGPHKGKSTSKRTCWVFSRIIPMEWRHWIDVGPVEHSLFAKFRRAIHLLRHCQQEHREEDGDDQFWRRKENLQNQIPVYFCWRSMESVFGSSRRSEKKISIVHWWFRKNHFFPSSSRTFRTQFFFIVFFHCRTML